MPTALSKANSCVEEGGGGRGREGEGGVEEGRWRGGEVISNMLISLPF